MIQTDVAVIGGGPAGAAAAIACAGAGLRVTVIERSAFPRHAPGETLHPGVEPLLEQLGVWREVESCQFLRHPGHWLRWDGPERFVPFGGDARGPWAGIQAWRPVFDSVLLGRAREAGAAVLQPCTPRRVVLDCGGRPKSVETSQGIVEAAFFIDATGRQRWLSNQLRLASDPHGPRRVVWYGYAEGDCPARAEAPLLAADGSGWTWVARVRPNLYQWTRWNLDGHKPAKNWLPDELCGLVPRGPTRGADVTCRIGRAPAGPGYYLTGDAAAVLDPVSSHGVLKALMSGMMAGHLIGQSFHIRAGESRAGESAAAAHYCGWLRAWFLHDVSELRKRYGVLRGPCAKWGDADADGAGAADPAPGETPAAGTAKFAEVSTGD